jgi:formylmethanofuran dehydrogenase subunit E
MEKSVKTNITIKCGKCGKLISEDVYEFEGVKLCEDCYMDEVIASQPKKCVMK